MYRRKQDNFNWKIRGKVVKESNSGTWKRSTIIQAFGVAAAGGLQSGSLISLLVT